MADSLAVEIIVPVRDMARHLDLCLASIMPQLRTGDRVTVVDDGSTDDTAAVAARHGATVLRRTTSSGPYAARNAAGQTSEADLLIFVDARSRALPGWLASHIRAFARPDIALSCTAMEVQRGESFAGHIAHVQNAFDVTQRVGILDRWDWFPTCNLGVRRTAFAAVDGFREIRSGADEDICRRVQLDGLGSMSADLTMLMEWAPRDSLRALSEQWYRYGKGSIGLENQPLAALPPSDGRHPPRSELETARQLARRAVRKPADSLAVLGVFALHAIFFVGRFVAQFTSRRRRG